MRRFVGVRAVGVTLWLAAASALPVMAQQAPPRASLNLDRLVADMNADDPWVRQEASVRLADGVFPLKEIEAQLARTDLSAEQRHRLMGVAASLFFSEPRAAMGISFAGERIQEDDPAAYIASTEPGFDANLVLRVEDRLDFFDGQRIKSRMHVIAMIQAHDPGDTVEVEVFRNGQVLPVKVRLGSRNELRGGGATALSDQAWRIRSAAYAEASVPQVVDCTAGPEAWQQPAGDPRRVVGRPGPVGVVMGGEARTVAQEPMALRNPDRRGPRTVRAVPDAAVPPRNDRELLALLVAQRSEVAVQLANYRQRLTNANLGERERRRHELQAEIAQRELTVLEDQIQKVTARMAR